MRIYLRYHVVKNLYNTSRLSDTLHTPVLVDVQVVRMFMYCNTIVNLSDILHTPFTGRVCEYTYRDCAVDTHSLTPYTHLYSQTCRLEEDR